MPRYAMLNDLYDRRGGTISKEFSPLLMAQFDVHLNTGGQNRAASPYVVVIQSEPLQ